MKKIKFPQLKIKVSATKGEEVIIRTSNDVINMLRSIFNADTILWTEEFIMVCLNRNNKVIGYYKVGIGGFSGVAVDVKVIMTIALSSAATQLIVAHNHPSGNLSPSVADNEMTKKIKLACNIMDIGLMDHIILTENSYYSYCDEGLL